MGTRITELPELAENAAPSDVVPVVDVSTGVTKKVTAQRAAVGGITGGTLPGVDFADPVLKTSAPDLGGSGAQLTPGGLTSGGTSGGVDLIIAPGAAAAGPGKAVLIQGGTGAASQDGGPLTLDAGGPNGGGSVAGNVRIGRDLAAEVLIGREGGGATVTLEGTVTTVGHTPTAPGHVATKDYVDAVAAGLSVKKSVRVATTGAGTLASSFEAGDTVDGVVLAAGDRILIKDQAAGQENGIYVVAASGAPTRATDMDAAAEIEAGVAVFVEEGTANANTGWVLTTDGAIVVGTTPLAFTVFSRHSVGLVGDIQPVGTAAAAGTSGKVADAGHVHAHGAQTDGSLHARVTASAHGFLDREVFDGALGKGTNWHAVWRETFKGTLDPKLAADASGTGAAAQVAVTGGYEGVGRLVGGTASAARGGHRAALNWWYNSAAALLRLETVGTILGPLADATNDYRVHLCGLGAPPTGSWTGYSIVYDRTAPANPGNWQLAKYLAGVATFVDLGVAADTASHRFETLYDPVAATVEAFIDGVSRGTISTVPSVSAAYPFAAYIGWVAGASREFYEEFSACWVKYLTARPG